jgi:hypothetical protein
MVSILLSGFVLGVSGRLTLIRTRLSLRSTSVMESLLERDMIVIEEFDEFFYRLRICIWN